MTSQAQCIGIDYVCYFTLTYRYSIDRSKDPGRRFIVTPDCEVKVKRGLDGETLDREALAGLPEPMYEVHILAKDKGNSDRVLHVISGVYLVIIKQLISVFSSTSVYNTIKEHPFQISDRGF